MFSQVRKFSSLSRVIQAPASTTKLSFAASQQLTAPAPADKSNDQHTMLTHWTYIDMYHSI